MEFSMFCIALDRANEQNILSGAEEGNQSSLRTLPTAEVASETTASRHHNFDLLSCLQTHRVFQRPGGTVAHVSPSLR